MAINLNTNRNLILQAWRDVVDDKTATNWAIFGYEGLTDVLTVICKGSDGIDEMKEELNSGKMMYAFCKVFDPKTSLNKYVLINWQGEGAPLLRKGVCANHIRDVSNILKGAHVTLNARTEEDVDSDIIIDKVSKSTASAYSFEERLDLTKDGFQKIDPVYKKVEPKNEINAVERDRFWALEEQQEKQRQLDEVRKKREELLKLEKERLIRETEDAKKRESIPDPVSSTNVCKKIPEATVSISRKIERIEKAKDSVDELKESRQKEAQELISQRTVDVRAVFEQNTSAGQLRSFSRKSSAQLIVTDNTNSDSHPEPKVNGDLSNHEKLNEVSTATSTEENTSSEIVTESKVPEILDERNQNVINYNDSMMDVGLKAQALYDYQAADDTEISFDPDDIITHIEQIDPGWWQGLGPDGSYGLFPANYVQLIP